MSGRLTIEEVEHRLLRALKTLDAVSDPDARHLAPPYSLWPDWVQDYHATHDPELLRSAIPKPARFRPTPADIDDMLPVLGWITAEVRDRLWLLRLRAYEYSFTVIASTRGRSREHWRRVYLHALELIGQEANRQAGNAPP